MGADQVESELQGVRNTWWHRRHEMSIQGREALLMRYIGLEFGRPEDLCPDEYAAKKERVRRQEVVQKYIMDQPGDVYDDHPYPASWSAGLEIQALREDRRVNPECYRRIEDGTSGEVIWSSDSH